MKSVIPYPDYKAVLDGYMIDAPEVVVSQDSRLVLLSDWHVSSGTDADDFQQNITLASHKVLPYYAKWRGIYLGDMLELWEASWQRIYKHEAVHVVLQMLGDIGKPIWILGNHDAKAEKVADHFDGMFSRVKFVPALKLVDIHGGTIALCHHGHEADYWNHGGWKTSLIVKPIVKYIWPWLQRKFHASSEPPFSPRRYEDKQTAIEDLGARYAAENGIILIQGHTHKPKNLVCKHGRYLNTGSGCKPGIITALEIQNEKATLVYWDDNGRHELSYRHINVFE